MITKEFVEQLKEDEGALRRFVERQQEAAQIVSLLENLGYLPKDFEGSFLFPLLQHEYAKIRLLAAKNIAKIHKKEHLEGLYQAFKNEQDTSVKREIVSAIGRLRKAENKPYLFDILEDEDPKIVF